jgi:ribosomal protein S27E
MAFISFRCTSCNQGLKIGPDKAGRKIKCSKCGTVLVVPHAGTAEQPAPVPSSEPRPKAGEDEQDDIKSYGMLAEPEAAEPPTEDAKAKKPQDKPPPLKRKLKTLSDLDLWEKVRTGLQVIMVGVYVWAGAVLFTVLLVILGIVNGPEYSEVVASAMTEKVNTPAGEVLAPDMPTFLLTLITGTGFQGIGKTFYILAALLTLLQILIMIAGYAIAVKVPDRSGMPGQIKALLTLGGLNFLLVLIFKLLPALGVMSYVLVPYATPEVAMIDANIGRDPPLWVFWSSAPFWDMTLSVLFMCLFYAQPIFIGVFIWSIGLALREDPVIAHGQAVVNVSFGVAFALLAYYLLSMAGTSGVAMGVMRIIYALWTGFTIILLIRLPMALQSARTILLKYLEGAELKDEEDEEPIKPKPKRKPKRAGDDDDD